MLPSPQSSRRPIITPPLRRYSVSESPLRKRQKVVPPTTPARKQVQASARPPSFTFVKERVLVNSGNNNEGLAVGVFTAEGSPAQPAIEKAIEVYTAMDAAGKPYARDRPAYLNDKLRPTFTYDLGLHMDRIQQKCETTHRCKHVARTLGNTFDAEKDLMYVYTEFYPNGDLKHFLKAEKRDAAARHRLLWGAWEGLYELHTTLNIIHGDLSPANIFVNHNGEGIIGDLEGTIVVRSTTKGVRVCEARYQFYGTRCYGAPFAHCDVRRDQVALLVTSLEVLSGVSWQEVCAKQLPKEGFMDANDFSTYGYEASADGLRISMTGDTTYSTFVAEIRSGLALRRIEPDHVLDALLQLGELLVEITAGRKPHEAWNYTDVHTQIARALLEAAQKRL